MPAPPRLNMFTVIGTTRAIVRWFDVDEASLRGMVQNRTYIVMVENDKITTSKNSANVTGPRASTISVQVCVCV